MPDSQNPEHTRKLIEEFQLKGSSLIPTVTGEIVPVVLVENLASGDSVRRYAHVGIQQAAVASQKPMCKLHNPAGSRVLAVLYQVLSSATNANLWQSGPATNVFATVANGQFVDRRLTGLPACEAQSQTAAANILVRPALHRQGGTAPLIIPLNVVLPPGSGFLLEGQTNNTEGLVSFYWYERDLLPNEPLDT